MQKYIWQLLVIVLLFLAYPVLAELPLHAVPACPEPFTIKQSDGSEFQAYNKGDEWSNWTETADGYPILLNEQTGFWEYGKLEPLIGLSLTNQIVGKDQPTGINKISASELQKVSGQRRLAMPKTNAGSSGAPQAPQPAPLNMIGTQKLLVILVNFTNRTLTTTESDWESRIFGATNSVKQYYDEVSYGQLTVAPAEESYGITNNGVISVTMAYTHPNTGTQFLAANQQLTKDAIIAADPFVDFSSFDSDSNGMITTNELHIMIIVAGFERSYAFGTPSVWAHKWTIEAGVGAPVVDGKTVSGPPGGYTQFGELHSTHQATIGPIVHELGHDLGTATIYFGLPDLYDANGAVGGNSDGVGVWDAMAGGSWNATTLSGDTPAHFSAWCKWYLGWVTPTQITNPTLNVLFPQTETALDADRGIKQLFDNPNGPEIGGTGEYFLLENRQKTGYDSALPGTGILIWHIDETQSDNNTVTRKLVDMEEADGLNELDTYGGDKGDTGDPYPGISVNRAFDNNSNPNSRFYSGVESILVVSNISNSSVIMSVDIISPFDLPPVLASPGDWNIDVNQSISFTLYADDFNQDPITYTMTSTPTGATLDSITGVFNWVPDYTQAGIYDIIFTASSTIFSDSKPARITVSQIRPPAPSGLSAIVISALTIQLNWIDNAPNEDGFRIERSYDNITFSQIAMAETDITSCMDTSISMGASCYYRVIAYNSAGDSNYSDTAFVRVSQTTSGSSGNDKHKSHAKCGCLGIEAVAIILLVRLIRRRKINKLLC